MKAISSSSCNLETLTMEQSSCLSNNVVSIVGVLKTPVFLPPAQLTFLRPEGQKRKVVAGGRLPRLSGAFFACLFTSGPFIKGRPARKTSVKKARPTGRITVTFIMPPTLSSLGGVNRLRNALAGPSGQPQPHSSPSSLSYRRLSAAQAAQAAPASLSAPTGPKAW